MQSDGAMQWDRMMQWSSVMQYSRMMQRGGMVLCCQVFFWISTHLQCPSAFLKSSTLIISYPEP